MSDLDPWKHQDMFAEDSTAEKYDYLYNRTNFATSMYDDFAHAIISYIHHGKVLELGCGTGIVSHALNQFLPQLERYCMDFSSQMLKIARTRCNNCIQADMEYLPYPNSRFDLVYVHSALHHFPSLARVVNEVKRILNEDGYFIIQEPNLHHLRKDTLLRAISYGLRKINAKQYQDVSQLEVKPSEHHAPLVVQQVAQSLENSGFAIEKSFYKYYSSYILNNFQNILINKFGRIIDPYYVKKESDGYMFMIIARRLKTSYTPR